MPDIDETRTEIRDTFYLWGVKPEHYSIEWEDKGKEAYNVRFKYGVRINYLRGGTWQQVSCMNYGGKNDNLRQCFYLIERLRIAEKHGVQYQGLSYSTDLIVTSPQDTEKERNRVLLEAYDLVGGGPQTPLGLIEKLYRAKCTYYHPDVPGTGDSGLFKRLTEAYTLICESRGKK